MMARLPILAWRDEWRQPGALRADLLAGLTGAIVVLPQGLAFATLAGMPPQYGLYAAMVPCLLAAIFGSSRLMVTGPANAISLTTMALLAPLAAVESPEYIRLALTLTFLVGALQLLLGLARVGAIVERVPHSVVVGFTAGAAVLILNSQLATLLGLPIERGLSVVRNLAAVAASIGQLQWPALVTGLVTIGVAVIARPINRIVPAMLIAVIAGSLTAALIGWMAPEARPQKMVGALPGALPPLSTPDLSIDTIRMLFGPTLVMTLLALTEAMAIARSVARKHGDRVDGNQEFIGQGTANLVGAFFSSFPASGSFNRSGVNLASGARTPLAAASTSLVLVLMLLFVAPLARYLPLSAIAGLLFVVAWGLIDRTEIARIWREEKRERAAMAITIVATVVLSLEWAILLGLTTSLIARRTLRP